MLDDILRMPFDFFATVIWDRFGPVAGILTALTMLATSVGLIVLAIAYLPGLIQLF